MRTFHNVGSLLILGIVAVLLSCGGGGGGGSNTHPAPLTTPHPILVILTNNLPIGVQGLPYTVTFTEKYGVAPVTWSVDSSTPLPPGLSLDATSGILSGTPTAGGANVIFQVTDSSNPPQTFKTQLLVPINGPLSLQLFTNVQASQYQSTSQAFAIGNGGISPYTYSIAQGRLPAGLKLDPGTGTLAGTPLETGSYNVVVALKDFYNPPEMVTQSGTVVVYGAGLTIGTTMNNTNLILNRPYSGTFNASGGTPPYIFQISSGTLPPGLALSDPVNGIVSGTPIRSGGYSFQVMVTDSGSMTSYAPTTFLSVSSALGRNDSPASATPIGGNDTHASISPAVDSSGTLVPDTDYYKLVAAAGSTVHVETWAKRRYYSTPLDTVIEITDLNGARFSTGCNQPGGTLTDFSSACLNDDISADPHVQDSFLDYKVPGNSGSQSFLVHVLDWSGSARPDMVYDLSVSGVIEPLKMASLLPTGTVGVGYLGQTFATGGTGTITFSITSGSPPPGLMLSSGNITGMPTTAGHYEVTIQGVDQNTPPQHLDKTYAIDIANPLVITTAALSNGAVGSPYSFQLTSTGGFGPIQWISYNPPPGLTLRSNGIMSGTPTQSGTFSVQINASDAGGYMSPQNVIRTIPITIN